METVTLQDGNVRLGMSVEQAREMYRLAMENYDELKKSSANGSVTEADEANMD